MTVFFEAGYTKPFTSLDDGVAAYTDVLKGTGGYLRGPA